MAEYTATPTEFRTYEKTSPSCGTTVSVFTKR
jgi:hypothetical protein